MPSRYVIILMISAESGFVNKYRIWEIMGLTDKSRNMNRALSESLDDSPCGKSLTCPCAAVDYSVRMVSRKWYFSIIPLKEPPMSDPYKSGQAAAVNFVAKRPVLATCVVVLKGTIQNRGLSLITPRSRCIREKEIFEFMVAEDPDAGPGGVANTVRYLGFAEVFVGGSILVGDRVLCDGRLLGWVLGFDETHMPNHQNVVFRAAEGAAELEERMRPGTILEFHLE